jgi:Flp pilus assembly protein TadG
VATYTVKSLVPSKALGNGSANVATWQYNNTGTGEAVARTLVFQGQAGATGQVNVEIGVTGATASATQRIIDSYVLTAALPFITNGWFTVPVSSFLSAWANSATVNGAAYGLLSV